ncbi:MAG: hypothetical protein K2H22_00980 [Muribaculaceae bacterium]|nr:hypothetical protein [Muribaculaceae bacterium]MDE5870510.1 hypothetical protein [Muribaculaceae bacterium]
MASADVRNGSGTRYVSDEFGYMIMDGDSKKVDIFKTIPPGDVAVNIANCKIKDATDRYLTISSLQPVSSKDMDIRLWKEYSQYPDSVLISIKLPSSEAENLYIKVFPSVGPQETYHFSSDGTVKFRLKKYDFEFDNFFSVVIFPEIYPFRLASSLGDSETLSFLDLRLDEILDVTDPALSKLKIDIPDFTNEIFRKWVILDDFVLTNGSDIVWRNIQFKNTRRE